MSTADLRRALAERVIVADGAMGTMLQAANLSLDDFEGYEGCNEVLNVTRPDVVKAIHDAYFAVGVDCVETNTFGANWANLAEYGIEHRITELARAGAALAREVADGWSTPDHPRWVLGSVGPGTKLPSLGHVSFAVLRDSYQAQVDGMLAGGVDAVLVETAQDLLQAKAAVIGARRAMAASGRQVPLAVNVTVETTGTMLLGSEIGAALTALEALGVDHLGLNCATGPAEMSEHLRYLSQNARVPLSVMPNAGLPELGPDGAVYPLGPEELAAALSRFVTEFGVRLVGGCCGTTPEHIRQVVDAVSPLRPEPREPRHEPSVSSVYQAVPFRQDASVLMIGERTNANGSKAFREAMAENRLDDCVEIAREQTREGAHLIDLCVDYVGRDGVADMSELAGRLATASTLPIMLDSTEPDVIAAGLERIGGRCVVNSVNYEDGDGPDSRFQRAMRVVSEHGAGVVALCIDEEGQARTAEWKVRVASRLIEDLTTNWGMDVGDIIVDCLTFPISTGQEEVRRDAIETIEAIRELTRRYPGVQTTLGVSNVSFGLNPAARQVLNSVFLHECVQAGLTTAIVHASKILPISRIPDDQREVALDLVYDRRRDGYDPLQRLMEMFEGASASSNRASRAEQLAALPLFERLEQRIVDGERNGLTEDLDAALEERPALEIVNETLLAGMKTVGELFGSGQMQLPFVLESAETMKAAVAHLEPHMEKSDSGGKGTIVLATVKGDVHDIGKNLVDIILSNNGYDVVNIGIKQPINAILEAAGEHRADAIGMSGLLVKSTVIMKENLEEMNGRGVADEWPVLLGGAALTRSYVERDLRNVYDGRLFYGKDAFEGLDVMDKLGEIRRGGEDDPDWGRVPSESRVPSRESLGLGDAKEVDPADIPDRSPDVLDDNPVFKPPFLGSRVVKGVSIDDIAGYVNETALFRNQWGYRPEKDADGNAEADDEFKGRVRSVFRDELAKAKADGLLIPQVVYGYYAANSDGNDLVIWADEDRKEELARYTYPRQTKAPYMCIADFFRPIDSVEVDYAAFQIVTMGPAISERTAKLFAENRYEEYLYLHGLGVEMAEALAEYWHRRVREEWGYADEDGPSLAGLFRQQYRGGRYSWGYPACPDLEDNQTTMGLLEGERIGLECNEDTGFQYQPEQSTSALICHHPQAKYFVAR